MTLPLDLRMHTLMRLLSGARWIKRDVIAQRLGWTVRDVRDTASHSHGGILSGPQGLCLIANATPDEIEHSRQILISQARQMIQRAMDIEVWVREFLPQQGTPAVLATIDTVRES